MDGVVVNSEPAYMKIEVELTSQLGIPLTEEEQKQYSGVHHNVMWKALKEKYGYEMLVDEIAGIESRMIDDYYKNGDLMPINTTIELIKELFIKGIKCAIATSSDGYNAEHVVKRLGISKYISAIASSSKVKNCKPAPDIFLLAADMLGLEPKNCIVIEDSKSGCIAAKAAGMRTVGYRNPYSGNQDLSAADIIVDDIGELSFKALSLFFCTSSIHVAKNHVLGETI